MTDAGSAYVLDANFAGATPSARRILRAIPNPFPARDDQFGAVVSVQQLRRRRRGPVGRPRRGRPTPAPPTSSGRPPATRLATLNNPNPTPGDRFGATVAQFEAYYEDVPPGSPNVVFTTVPRGGGALGDDSGASDAGSVYVFDLNNPPAVRNDTAVVIPERRPRPSSRPSGTTPGSRTSASSAPVSAVTQGTSGGTVAIVTHVSSATGGSRRRRDGVT